MDVKVLKLQIKTIFLRTFGTGLNGVMSELWSTTKREAYLECSGEDRYRESRAVGYLE
jgi:hypothetical protein